MHCMKCGRELKDSGVFCPECSENMERYPVKPGTPVQLPPRSVSFPVKKKPWRRALKPEEQIARLRSCVRWLSLAVVVLVIAFALVTLMLLQFLEQRDAIQDLLSTGLISQFF